MNNISWIFYVSKRYFKTKRKEKGHAASILSVSGIAIGVMTLITVIAVMNGFQQGFITNINEIRSFHIRIEGGKPLNEETEREILSVKGVNSVTQFADVQTIIQGIFNDQKGAAVRAVDENIMKKDKGFAERMAIVAGEFNLTDERSIVLGYDLAYSLGVRPGDTINLLTLSGKGYEKLSPANIEFVVKGLFRCGFAEINNSMAFIPLSSAALFVPESDFVYGVKLDNHYKDYSALKRFSEMESLKGMYVESWRNYNRSFFSALLMEKVMMMVLISLIFIVVAVNIFHSMKRSVVERIDEIALMKAVGATPYSIQLIFILDGALIGIFGCSFGTALGYIVSYNINRIFDLVEKTVNFFNTFVSGAFGEGGPINDINIYTGSSYYLQEVPIVIMSTDVLFIISMALLSTFAAAWYASKGISSIRPAAVLRFE
ncbi:MAG: ABC transporter permease [Spirochaetaceae bacterium]|jgi:lipoprotein-releasing system permease protein|nr:ABC transporter permease [Spirochaetaceae bacterium]